MIHEQRLPRVVSELVTGPSTLQSPYVVPADSASGTIIISIASNGNGALTPDETFLRLNTGVNDYRLVGLPDGMGAFRTSADVTNGTFTLLCNHELGNSSGIVRDHGNRGSFVSQWTISADTFNMFVVGARDAATTYNLFDLGTNSYVAFDASNPMPEYSGNVLAPPPAVAPFNGIGRHCSADLPGPGAFKFGSLGTDARIFMNGEEIGNPGRAFAYVVTGPGADQAWELPRLGDYSWENSVASPFAQEKTIVIGLDDSSPGNVYVYVGTKQSTGNDIERAGLTNGTKYGIVISGVTVNGSGQCVEDAVNILGDAASGPIVSKPFSMLDLGDQTNVTGNALQSLGDAQCVLNWLRPEDGAWDPQDPNRFYFVTTATFSTGTRIWELAFTDITQPELGGVATMLADGLDVSTFAGGLTTFVQPAPVPQVNDLRQLDNFCTTPYGQLLIQEDVGSNGRLGRTWLYDIASDSGLEVAISDAARFQMGVDPNQFLTTNEENSGIIDACGILGSGWYLTNMQAHYGIAGELAEGGQLQAMYVPAAACPGDLDCDGDIDQSDLNLLLASFGLCQSDNGWFPPAGNLAGPDGCVTQDDLNVVLANFDTSCN